MQRRQIDQPGQSPDGRVHLRQVLDAMFPPSYIELYHKYPNSVCSLLQTKRCQQKSHGDKEHDRHHDESQASSEPHSRASLVRLRQQLNWSLQKHQAKPVGLCPVRRAIFEQCFDELLRQVTVGCIEQGLLLFRVRNELKMSLNYYRKAYEAGVQFGLSKALDAEFRLETSRLQIRQLESRRHETEADCCLRARSAELELRNRLHSADNKEEHYRSELEKKERVIEQQRAIIRALSQKCTGDIESPLPLR